eukprot:6091308-Pyramimonas_sp.AAC.1
MRTAQVPIASSEPLTAVVHVSLRAPPGGQRQRQRERERERAPCQADNTPAEQKNQWLLIFSSWLVACGRAASVSTEYFVVGHTHCKVDQRFSIIA